MKYACQFTVILLLGAFHLTSCAQNHVPNYGFEILDSCPLWPSQLAAAQGWVQPTLGTSDAFHTCTPSTSTSAIPNTAMGFKTPRTGNGMAGILGVVDPSWREYIQRRLSVPLTGGVGYEVQAYVSLAGISTRTTDEFGFFFSTSAVGNLGSSLPLTAYSPQVVNPGGNFITSQGSDWMLISGTFIANGGEEFVTIGNFESGLNPSTIPITAADPPGLPSVYVFIDDICVSPVGGTGCGVLPFSNLELMARRSDGSRVKLEWTTTVPEGTEGFRILRGPNPEHMEDWEYTAVPTGESQETWTTTDFNPPNEPVWYQLVQVSLAGEQVHSEFVLVPERGSSELIKSLHYNKGTLNVCLEELEGEKVTFWLRDPGARQLVFREFSRPLTQEKYTLPLPYLPPGLYILTVTTSTGRSSTQKLSIF